MSLARLLDALARHHGRPPSPPTGDPFELVLWENVAYLADDGKRAAAFAALKRTVGTLTRFPGIGEPGAEKVLLFSRSHPVFAMDSNVLRVLLRVGYGQERKSYASTYRSVQQAGARSAASVPTAVHHKGTKITKGSPRTEPEIFPPFFVSFVSLW